MAVPGRPPIVRSGYDRRLRDYLARNGPVAGLVAGAGNVQSAMLLMENATGTVDTTNKWTTAVGGTGSAAAISYVEQGLPVVSLVCAADLDTTALSSKALFASPTIAATPANYVYKKLIAEWNVIFEQAVTRVATGSTFLGLGFNASSLGTTNNVMGFRFGASSKWDSVVDQGGTEETTAGITAAIVTNAVNKMRMEMSNAQVLFYYNDALVATHNNTTPATIPVVPMRFCAYLAQTGASAANMGITSLRCYLKDEV